MNFKKIKRENNIMRLWHYKLLKFLPKSQFLAQWRELNSIFKKQDKKDFTNFKSTKKHIKY